MLDVTQTSTIPGAIPAHNEQASTAFTINALSPGLIAEFEPSLTPNQQPRDARREPGEQRNKDGDSFIPSSTADLSDEDKAKVEELKQRDAEVRAHEQAHASAAGGLALGAPHYEYETGPDGRRYVVDGHVDIDMSPGSTPEETLAKAEKAAAAATAPAQLSTSDRAVAAKAQQMAAEARREIQQNKQDELAQRDNPAPGIRTTGAHDMPSPGTLGRNIDIVA